MNGSDRALYRYGARAILFVLALSGFLTGWNIPVPVFALVFGALLATDGVRTSAVLWYLLYAIALELISGFEPGILSLPFAGVAVLILAAHRWLSITPLTQEPEWSSGAFIRALVLGSGAALGIAYGSLAAVRILYGQTLSGAAALSMLSGGSLAWTAGAVGVMLTGLHLADVPLRRPRVYGT